MGSELLLSVRNTDAEVLIRTEIKLSNIRLMLAAHLQLYPPLWLPGKICLVLQTI